VLEKRFVTSEVKSVFTAASHSNKKHHKQKRQTEWLGVCVCEIQQCDVVYLQATCDDGRLDAAVASTTDSSRCSADDKVLSLTDTALANVKQRNGTPVNCY